MKRYLLPLLAAALFLCAGTSHAQIAPYSLGDDGVYYLKTSDGHEEYTVDGEVTFKCVKSGNIPGYRDAGVTFSPANPGEIIQATVEEVDLDGTTNYLLLYHGYIKTGYSNASDGKGQSAYMPAGWFEKIGASAVGSTYESTSEDGKLTFGFHSSSANNQKGFTIKVTSLSQKDMEFVSAGAFLENTAANRGGRNQILLGVNILMDGGNQPLKLTELTLNTSGLLSDDVENIRIYSTDKFIAANLLTTNTSPQPSISISSDITLRSGKNHFYVVADIKPNATAGNSLPVSLTSVKVDGEAKTIDPSSPQAPSAVANDILIAAEHLTYTISDNTNFYDDGGKDGKITEQFNGAITFIPATAGSKIKVDFSKFEIFNTSSVGYNDVFKFYNGQSVDEGQLITTLLAEPELVKSTADDGSMTITFKSVTGIPANGWEATVSQFIPGPMSYDETTTYVASTETLAAGNTDESILIFSIKTTNTLNPLELQSITFDAAGTTSLTNIAKAKVYYLGKKNIFSTSNPFGDIISIGSNTFTITGSQNLTEGNSYFALVYDIAEQAENNDVVSGKLASVKLSGTDYTIAESAVGQRSIHNIFKSLGGTHTRTMYGSWVYTDTKSPYSSSYYNYVDEDCVITFIPSVSGAVAEIDFSKFDVYYATSAYGVKAVFEIYSGATMSEENLLWKLDSNEKSKTGPQKKLRSTAADGAITVKFNAKTTSSYYAGTGWEATATPFVDHNMTVEEVAAFQNNTANIKPSATNQEIIGIEVITEGTLAAAVVQEFKLDLKNSLESISKATILYSAGEKDFSQGIEFGSIASPSTKEVTITGTQALPEGKSYFWLSYDTKVDIESDVQIDAALLSVKVDDAEYTPVIGDPDGYRLTKNTIELAQNDNGTITVAKNMMFYDDGGPDDDYSLSFDGKITFVPSAADQVVKLNFNEFKTNAAHYFYVYSGTEENDDKLIAKLSGTTSTNIPEQLLGSLADGGVITVRFVSTSSGVRYLGWAIEVSSYTPLDLFVESITTSQVGDNTIMRGSGKEPVQKIIAKIGGDEGSIVLNSFKFNTGLTANSSDITTARLYYTKTSSGFIDNNQFGSDAVSSSMVFEKAGGEEITAPGEYYFWLAYDISALADAGNKIGAKLTAIAVDAVENTSITEENTVERTIKEGFKGVYTIGKSGMADYETFASAISAMSEGIEGAVTFKVEAGTYPENVKISGIKGTSETNTITFTSLSGENNDVIIKGAGYSDPPYGEVKYGMFTIEATSHVALENITFKPTSQAYPNNIHLRNVSRYFTLRNCILEADLVTSGYAGMRMVYTEGINEEGMNNDFYTIENNTITGGYIALYLGGTSYVRLTKEQGIAVRNNTINNACGKGIYVFDVRDALIEGNTIVSETTQKTGYQGMDIFRCKDNVIIRNNKIVNKQAYYSTGIEVRTEAAGTAEKTAYIYNNSIAIINSPNSSTYGISITGDCSYIHLYHNSINIKGSGGYLLGIVTDRGTAVPNNIVIQNNLLQSNTTAPVYFFYRDSYYQNTAFKNNAYHFTGTNFTGGSSSGTYDSWLVASGEQNSIVEEADFFTDTDLHLKTEGNLNSALPVGFITTDISGVQRSATTPTIGAYECTPVVIEVPVMEEGYPKVISVSKNSALLNVKLSQTGKLYSMVMLATETAPTATELKAMQPINIDQSVLTPVTFNGLTELTEYKAYFYMESIFDTKSAVIESEAFTTLKDIPPMVVNLPTEWDWVAAGTAVTIDPDVIGGVPPYQYEWKNEKGEILSTDAALVVTPTVVTKYILNIKDSNIEDQTLRTVVWIDGEKVIATFEDLYLDSESYWKGYDDEMQSVFYSGSYSFSNTCIPPGTWGGFSYSNVTSTDFNPLQFLTHQFRSVTGKGVAGSNTYSVSFAFGSKTEVAVMHDMLNGDIVDGVYLTNAAYTMHSILNGDSYGGPFSKGDWYKVIFKGNLAEGGTSTVEYYLADYRSENVSERYVLDDWKWFDLSVLGKVTSIEISVDGSRKNLGGLTTPGYFCSDNWGSPAPQQLDVNSTITVKAISNNSATLEVTIDKEGKLYRMIRKASEAIPAVNEILAANDYVSASINVPLDITFESLVVSTEYKAYFILVDQNYNQSDIIESPSFTTDRNPIIVEQEIQSITHNSATFKVTSTDAGKLYQYIQGASEVTPDMSTILSGSYVAIGQDEALSVTFTGLVPATEYCAFFVVADEAGYRSGIVKSAPFTTSSDPIAEDIIITQSLLSVTESSAIFKVASTHAGTLYRYIQIANEAAPDISTILSGDNVAIGQDEQLSVTFAGLAPSTEYKAYFIVVDQSNNQSGIAISSSFKTDTNPILNEIVIAQNLLSVEAGSATFEVSSTHAGLLYQYIQESNKPAPGIQTIIAGSNANVGEDESLTITFTGLMHSTEYIAYFVVVDADDNRSNISISAPFRTKEEELTLSVSINEQLWNIENRYVIDCGGSGVLSIEASVPSSYLVLVDGTETPNGRFTVSIDKSSVVDVEFTVKSRTGDFEKTYKITAEKYFAFEDIIIQRWNNTLLINNNGSTNGGYEFVNIIWFKDNVAVGNGSFYSAGPKKADILDASAEYYARLTTKDGQILHTCPARITLKAMSIKAYPSPVSTSSIISIEADLDDELLQNAVVEIYSIMGARVSSAKVQGKVTRLTAPSSPGTYVVIVKSGDFRQEQKILVK